MKEISISIWKKGAFDDDYFKLESNGDKYKQLYFKEIINGFIDFNDTCKI